MSFNPESVPRHEPQESELKQATIRLEFFRHDAKTAEATAGPRSEDADIRLTLEGRNHAKEQGKEKDPHPETSIVYGSMRDRAMETSLRHMLANDERVTNESSLEDMRALVGSNISKGRKDIATQLLDFEMEGNPEFNKVAYEHYIDKKDLLDWLWKESDRTVRDLHDKESSSYSRMAGNVAELINKYINIFPRWQKITESESEKYAQFNNELQRHFGSHQSVLESFLMKVIQKTDGEEAVSDFIGSLKSRNGLDFSEGFSVEIEGGAEQEEVKVTFRDNQWKVDRTTIREIVAERDELDESIENYEQP
ncbi:MAG: hypothetical protein ABIP54_00085 [Candidatus Andersenbacteria bacterium]